MIFRLFRVPPPAAFVFALTAILLGPVRAEEANAPVTLSKVAFHFEVPFEKQTGSRQCGLAAANMVCGYYGQPLSKTQQKWLVSVSKAGAGITGAEMMVSFRTADYESAVFAGTLDHEKTGIYYHLDHKRPLIVMITSKDKQSSHYDVLNGYDPKKGYLLLLDPASGPMTISEKDFAPAWKRANNFTLLAIPQKIAAQETPTH
ncbi:MAG TPA: papain-like cysteine protease family protein [bacterium]|nr:papain-like cysteine protease family protein [bacterium]